MSDLQETLTFAIETAAEAGRLTLGYFGRGLAPDWKTDQTPVTVADREAEALIRARIEARFPTHGILGEEHGAVAGGSHRWIIDPIDGTRSFVRGVPLYAVLLALEIDGRVEVGVAEFPALGERIWAARGLGCWWNGRPARVSAEDRLERALVAHIDTASFARASAARGRAWQRLQQASGYNAGWCDAYAYLLVATGRADVALDPVMNPWDIAPFLAILPEAGGYCGDWAGAARLDAGEGLATNAALKDAVLAVLANDR